METDLTNNTLKNIQMYIDRANSIEDLVDLFYNKKKELSAARFEEDRFLEMVYRDKLVQLKDKKNG